MTTAAQFRASVLVTTALAATLLAGCGSDGGASTIPEADTSTGTGSEADESTDGESDSAEQVPTDQTFAECMRAHDVEVSDPDPETGVPQFDPAVDPDSPAVQKAMADCEHLLEGGGRSEPDSGEMDVYLEFAQCMRENGLPDFPDPQPGSEGLFGGAGVDRSDPAFQQAAETCQHHLDQAGE